MDGEKLSDCDLRAARNTAAGFGDDFGTIATIVVDTCRADTPHPRETTTNLPRVYLEKFRRVAPKPFINLRFARLKFDWGEHRWGLILTQLEIDRESYVGTMCVK